jgi:hypothetical protein
VPGLSALLDENSAAVRDFVQRAAAVPEAQWQRPRAPGKWTPAQEVEHVALSYELFAVELRGGCGMRVVTSRTRQLLLRGLALPYILRTGRFPGQPRAPRETRPTGTERPAGSGAIGTAAPAAQPGRAELLERLSAAVVSLEAALGPTDAAAANRRLTHAYFGPIPLKSALRLAAVHTRHHARNLPLPAARPP